MTQTLVAPPRRDLAIDAARVLAVGAVVFGHTLVAAVAWRSGGFTADNVLVEVPWTHVLTLVFQVMPLVFLCSGVAAAASLEGNRAVGPWLAARVERLLAPLSAYAAVAATAVGMLSLAGVDGAAVAGRALGMHLWFLAALLLVTVGAPVAVAADRRFGLRVPVGLLAGAACVDLLGGGWLNLVFVWGFAHQVGIAWRSGRFDAWSPRTGFAAAAAAFAGIAALVFVFDYPLSMVSVPGAGRSNAGPPSLAMALLAIAQAGLLFAGRNVMARPRLAALSPLAMAAYLWHFAAIVVAALVVLPTRLLPSPPAGSSSWWASRPLWLAAVTGALVLLLPVARRFSGRPRPGDPSTARATAGTVLAAVGCVTLTTGGLQPRPGLLVPAALILVARTLVRSHPR